MAVISLQAILQPAYSQRYGVPAFNMVNDLTMDAVLMAASQARSPVIIQVSVKTVRFWGISLIKSMFLEMVNKYSVIATLHLDHCPDAQLIQACLHAGWNSALFDVSCLDYQEGFLQTKMLVEFARKYGAHIEGELEAIAREEDRSFSPSKKERLPLAKCLEFIRKTGIACFGPEIGTMHGMYRDKPAIDFDRVASIVDAEPIPLVLHGGTGLDTEDLRKLIARGISKVNFSTQLKITYLDSIREYLQAHSRGYDPLHLMRYSHGNIVSMAAEYMHILGSEGKA